MSVANYAARKVSVDGFEVLRLVDSSRQTEVSIVPAFGNNAYEMKVKGKNVFWAPFTLRELKPTPAFFMGNPLMAPWANRLDWDGFHANGKKYALDSSLGNFPRDGSGLPIHGLLAFSPAWKVTALQADGGSARATCRLEFGSHPDLMAQFPFAHAIEVTHRLREGILEVETVLENHAAEPMPVALGYHPFFQVHDAPRAAWTVHLAAREQMLASEGFLPLGKTAPLGLPDPSPLPDMQSAYLLPDLVSGADGRSEFWLQGKTERVTVIQGPKYPVAVVYAPPGENYVCFEPMAATVNALNPARGENGSPVQSVPPGGAWRESFWIQASGF